MSKALVCLPTLNEKQSIALMIDQIKALGLDLVICDAGSTDGTVEIAKEKGITVLYRDAPGKGSGMQKALQYGNEEGYDSVLFIDCDETYPVNDIPKLLSNMGEYKMVVGARSQKQVAFINGLGNHGFNFLINTLFWGKLKDINSGMRALDVKTYLPLIDANNFDVETQISCLTLKHRIKYLEIPIQYAERNGQSKVQYRDGFSILWRIARERFK
jgi:glycosyltransferase involved in cell wall biosynthesis